MYPQLLRQKHTFENSSTVHLDTLLNNFAILQKYVAKPVFKFFFIYRNSVGCLLLFDVTNRESFSHIPTWMNEAKRHIEPHKAVFILVGCKVDLEGRQVPEEEARAFAQVNNLPYVETSSKTGLNVEDAFAILTQNIYDKIESGEYQVDGVWDGIKRGFYGGLTGGNSLNNNYQNRTRNGIVNLVEAQAERKLCC